MAEQAFMAGKPGVPTPGAPKAASTDSHGNMTTTQAERQASAMADAGIPPGMTVAQAQAAGMVDAVTKVNQAMMSSQDDSRFLFNAGMKLEFGHIASGKTVAFKAFLTNYAEQYTSQWNMESALGRMDPIHTFKNTNRTITLGWTLVCNSVAEAIENQRNLSRFIQMLYPSYNSTDSDVKVMSSPPLLKLKFMNLIQNVGSQTSNTQTNPIESLNGSGVMESGLVGRIDGLAIVPNADAGYITIPSTETGATMLYPKTIGLNCTFYAIHTHPLGWEKKKFMNPAHPYGMDTGFSTVSDAHNSSAQHAGDPMVTTNNDGVVAAEDPDQTTSDPDGSAFAESVTIPDPKKTPLEAVVNPEDSTFSMVPEESDEANPKIIEILTPPVKPDPG